MYSQTDRCGLTVSRLLISVCGASQFEACFTLCSLNHKVTFRDATCQSRSYRQEEELKQKLLCNT